MRVKMAFRMRSVIFILLILAGVVAVGFGILDLFYIVEYLIYSKIPTETLAYSGKQVDLVTDVAKTMIPTVTGFVVLLAPATGHLLKRGYFVEEKRVAWAVTVFALAVVSLGLWIAALTAMINCAHPFDQLIECQNSRLRGDTALYQLNIFYFFGIRAVEFAIIAFFLAVDLAVIMTTSLLGGHNSALPDD